MMKRNIYVQTLDTYTLSFCIHVTDWRFAKVFVSGWWMIRRNCMCYFWNTWLCTVYAKSERIGLPLSRATEAAEDTWARISQVFKVLAHHLNSPGKQYTRETQKGKEAVKLNPFWMFYKQPGVWRISETDTGIERDRGRDKESANVELCIESRGFSWSGGRARHPALQHSLYALVWEASQWEPQNTSSTKKREENITESGSIPNHLF